MTTATDTRRAGRLAERYQRYAVKFCLDSDAEPTDANLSATLAGCVRPPRPDELARIRAELPAARAEVQAKRALERRADKMGAAGALARLHWLQGIRPFGDLAGDGSALLMDALGETGPTTEANHADRLAMVDAYARTAGVLALSEPPR